MAAHRDDRADPILERRFGAVRVGFNANMERDLGEGEAGGTSEGWEFEPSAVVGVAASRRVFLKLEYRGAWGELTEPLAPRAQSISCSGIGLRLGAVTLGWSVGAGTANAANRLVFASRAESASRATASPLGTRAGTIGRQIARRRIRQRLKEGHQVVDLLGRKLERLLQAEVEPREICEFTASPPW